jgi:hypothetical protein
MPEWERELLQPAGAAEAPPANAGGSSPSAEGTGEPAPPADA